MIDLLILRCATTIIETRQAEFDPLFIDVVMNQIGCLRLYNSQQQQNNVVKNAKT